MCVKLHATAATTPCTRSHRATPRLRHRAGPRPRNSSPHPGRGGRPPRCRGPMAYAPTAQAEAGFTTTASATTVNSRRAADQQSVARQRQCGCGPRSRSSRRCTGARRRGQDQCVDVAAAATLKAVNERAHVRSEGQFFTGSGGSNSWCPRARSVPAPPVISAAIRRPISRL